jgi:hypothetical protein
MSLVISLFGEEGVVMASDSRLTINNTLPGVQQVGVSQSDTNYKTFLADDRIGISTWGNATIGGAPIAGFIENFIRETFVDQPSVSIKSVPGALVKYFNKFSPVPETGFQVAGYNTENGKTTPHVYRVLTINSTIIDITGTTKWNVIWDGESDILTRILNEYIVFKDQTTEEKMPHFGIPFHMFTLQDMIDFAVYAIRTTADSMRFQLRPKTVGGPIDVLVIKPSGAQWIRRKQLNAP